MQAVGPKNAWALRKLLERKFERAMATLWERHDFSIANPDFELTLTVNAHEFAEMVLEAQVSNLQKILKEHQETIEKLERRLQVRFIVERKCPQCHDYLTADNGNVYCPKCKDYYKAPTAEELKQEDLYDPSLLPPKKSGLPYYCPKCNATLIKKDEYNAHCADCGHVVQYTPLDY